MATLRGIHPASLFHSELNLHAMRLGPGKHLKGRTLANGVVTPEEYDYFHELVINQVHPDIILIILLRSFTRFNVITI